MTLRLLKAPELTTDKDPLLDLDDPTKVIGRLKGPL